MPTFRQARADYFQKNNFGVDGGYSDAWVHFQFGFVPLIIPNTKGRQKAVQYHDLQHILTGYETDWRGEFEQSAWEMSTGCFRFFAAFMINSGGMAVGAFSAPKRTWNAFVRGQSTRNLYDQEFTEALLEQDVETTRVELGLAQKAAPATIQTLFRYVFFICAGAFLWLSPIVILIFLVSRIF